MEEETAATTSILRRRPHVALLCSPGVGHLIPFTELALRLARLHGFSVTLLANPLGSSAAIPPLLPVDGLPFRFVPLPDTPPDAGPPTQSSSPVPRIVRAVACNLPHVRAALDSAGPPVDALVVDMFSVDALDVARERRVPCYMFFTSPCTCLALLRHVPALHEAVRGSSRSRSGPPGVSGEQLRGVGARGVRGSERRRGAGPTGLPRGAAGPDGAGRAGRGVPDQVAGPAASGLGGVRVVRERGDALAGADARARPGTGGERAQVLVGREEPGRRAGPRRVFRGPKRAGGGVLAGGVCGEDGGVGLAVARWAPQAAVLGHAAVGGFVTHCGWNSALESIASGVPMIAWPLYAEQRMNAAMLADEAGVALRPQAGGGGLVGREEVARAIRRLMEGQQGEHCGPGPACSGMPPRVPSTRAAPPFEHCTTWRTSGGSPRVN
uniref:Glycosyltransferase n=1 Tax=Ananas comosus var. bracteatus TaxID=296719 RepID=A0A6V7QGZ7_ANACO|nr:unnamed protein product [Ananas comosus var. bracteatus]